MSFWLREIAGWTLLGLGLVVFAVTLSFLVRGAVWPTVSMTVIGVFLFRGGIHLLKVALAARICEQAAVALREPPPAAPRPRA
jgi:uncharacterized membrane protein YidH (DUF202 family)